MATQAQQQLLLIFSNGGEMVKKRLGIFVIIAAAILLCFKTTQSSPLHTVKQLLRINTDTVEVRLVNTEAPSSPVVPESVHSIKSEAVNMGASAYLRFKVKVYIDDIYYRDMTNEDLKLADKYTLYDNGFYYVQNPMHEDAIIPLYEQMTLHSDIVQPLAEGQKITIETTLQAIQEKHFKPDWDAVDPWYGQDIQSTVRSRKEVER